VLKIMSKMGISTVSSYAGSQVFEAVGLSEEFVRKYFTGTETKLGGIGVREIAVENQARHDYAYPEDGARAHERLWTGGEYQWRRDGAPHLFTPDTVFRLQHSTRTRRYDIFREYTKLVDDQAAELKTLRDVPTQDRRASARADRRGGARLLDRQAFLHGCDELRLDLEGGARDPRHRDELDRREVEHG
jgi:glutamate synthase domain-containing protein 2